MSGIQMFSYYLIFETNNTFSRFKTPHKPPINVGQVFSLLMMIGNNKKNYYPTKNYFC